jgi:putative transposase
LKLEFSARLSWLAEELRTMKALKFTEAQKASFAGPVDQGPQSQLVPGA